MKRAKQLGFELLDIKSVKYFGGAHLGNSNPKTKRPISTKKGMHVVMRSTLARGRRSFLKCDQKLRRILETQATRFGVTIYRLANGGNHIHLIILPSSRPAFKAFIRSASGLIARAVLGAERGRSQGLQFWDKRPFTRIIEWGKEFRIVSSYLIQNTLEALGFIPYQPRKTRFNIARSTG